LHQSTTNVLPTAQQRPGRQVRKSEAEAAGTPADLVSLCVPSSLLLTWQGHFSVLHFGLNGLTSHFCHWGLGGIIGNYFRSPWTFHRTATHPAFASWDNGRVYFLLRGLDIEIWLW